MCFSLELIRWYKVNKRELPWRNTTNPYYIWLSEVILQQTRVDQGLPYYLRYVKAFPTVYDLSVAQEDVVLKYWQGLGYYSRARNMHITSKYIVKKYNGQFPGDYHKLLQLKGVGPYTAAAISSFAFSLPYAVVDGNVIRVLSRFFGIKTSFESTLGKKQFQDLAQQLLIKGSAAIYNQAIMEFGALQCKPKCPDCFTCPIQEECVAYNTNKINDFPVKSRKTKIKIKYLHFFLINTDNNVWIKKRDLGIWKGLYEFPCIEFGEEYSENEVMNSAEWNKLFLKYKIEVSSVSDTYIHYLSHQKIYAKFWTITSLDFCSLDYNKYQKDSLINLPVSRLLDKYLKTLFFK